MNSFYHAQSAAHKWGGTWEDYIEIESFIDSSKKTHGDYRHRAMYHHTLGVYLCEDMFGKTITIQKNKKSIEVPVRLIAERHIVEDLGFLPSPADYLKHISYDDDSTRWMSGSIRKEIGNMNDVFS